MSSETPAPPTDDPKRSSVEIVKEASRHLRGSIAGDLAGDVDHFSDGDKNLLKFHGTYQQEDRDARKSRKKDGVGKHYMFMVRCRIPGGKLTAAQYLAVDDLADRCANGTLRLTTRQGIQLHGVLKGNLKETIASINRCLLSTLGACGDVERNVMAHPAPIKDPVFDEMQRTADRLAEHLAPRTKAYHEIWLNGVRSGECGMRSEEEANTPHSALPTPHSEEEPIYGKVYLPRKFKTGLGVPWDNLIDIYAQDLGLLAHVENGKLLGYNLLVGGGMGMTHGKPETFPHIGRPICYVPAERVVAAAEAVIKLFRDHGNRADRKRARIKYLVHDWGVDKFREVLRAYLPDFELPKPVEITGFDLHLGWRPQGDGKFYYGISVENGRIKDEGTLRLRSCLRALMERLQPLVRLTPQQDLLLCDLPASARADIDRTLEEYGVARPDQISTVQSLSMACPAIPTCGLALSESERTLPGLIDQLEVELKRLGLEKEPISVRMTGCPNGCARPYQSDIGLVGRSGDKYTVYVGGSVRGERLNFVLRDLVPLRDIVPTLVLLLVDFKKRRQKGEEFGAWCQRLGAAELQELLPPLPEKAAKAHAVHSS